MCVSARSTVNRSRPRPSGKFSMTRWSQPGGSRGLIRIERQQVDTPAKLTPVLQQILAGRQEQTVYLEADRSVPYGRVVQVMAAIRQAGVTKLGMVAQEPEPLSKR